MLVSSALGSSALGCVADGAGVGVVVGVCVCKRTAGRRDDCLNREWLGRKRGCKQHTNSSWSKARAHDGGKQQKKKTVGGVGKRSPVAEEEGSKHAADVIVICAKLTFGQVWDDCVCESGAGRGREE